MLTLVEIQTLSYVPQPESPARDPVLGTTFGENPRSSQEGS